MATHPISSSIKKRKETRHRGVYEKVPGTGIWWVRYFDAVGRKHREKVGRKSDAIAVYQQRKSDVRSGAKLPRNMRTRGERLADVLDRAVAWYASHRPKALKNVTIHINAIRDDLGDRVAADLTPGDVDKWISSQTKWTPATMNRYKATLGRALQLEVISGKLDRNVARLVPARRENNARVRWLKDDEEKRIIATINKNCPEQLPAFVIAIHTGMRQSEEFSLEWSEIDFERRKIFLDKTKNGTNREVPMSDTCFRVLTELREKRKQRIKEGKEVNRWVFQSSLRDGQRLQSPKKWWETVLRDAKVDDFHWHDLRHSFCSRLVMRGVDLRTVMELAGHKSIQVTARYAHLAPEHNIAAIKKLDEVQKRSKPSRIRKSVAHK